MNPRLAVMVIACVTMVAPACAAEKFVGLKTEPILFHSPSLCLEHNGAEANQATSAISIAQSARPPNRTADRSDKGAATVMPSESRRPTVSGADTALVVIASFAAMGFVAHRRRPS